MRVNSSSPRMSREKSSPMMSLTSPPEQKPRAPEPVSTTARTLVLLVQRTKVSRELAVDLEGERVEPSGRSRVTVATPSPSS